MALLTFGGGDAKASGVCDGRLLRIKQGYGEDSRFPMSLVGGPLERGVLRLLGKRIGFPFAKFLFFGESLEQFVARSALL